MFKQEKLLMQCAGKEKFDTFAKANKVAAIGRRRNHDRLAPYRCKICNNFHIGHWVKPRKIKKLNYVEYETL